MTNKEKYFQEAGWIQQNLEVLNQTSMSRVEQMVLHNVPETKDKCKGWEDWKAYALGFLDGWMKNFLINAHLISNVINERDYNSRMFYSTCYKSHEEGLVEK